MRVYLIFIRPFATLRPSFKSNFRLICTNIVHLIEIVFEVAIDKARRKWYNVLNLDGFGLQGFGNTFKGVLRCTGIR